MLQCVTLDELSMNLIFITGCQTLCLWFVYSWNRMLTMMTAGTLQ